MRKLFTLRYLLPGFLLVLGITNGKAQSPVNHIVISQVYGGGRKSGSTYKKDLLSYSTTALLPFRFTSIFTIKPIV